MYKTFVICLYFYSYQFCVMEDIQYTVQHNKLMDILYIIDSFERCLVFGCKEIQYSTFHFKD